VLAIWSRRGEHLGGFLANANPRLERGIYSCELEGSMASAKQRQAARKNIKKAAAAAKKKRTIANLPKSVRTALGKQAAKVAKQKRRKR